MEDSSINMKYSLDELYGDLYKCVNCDIYRGCGIDYCESDCKCYVCIKCFGCPGCSLFDPYDFDFPENQSHMEECEDKLLNSVHQPKFTDKTSFKKIYCKKTDTAINENEYVIQRPLNTKFKHLERNAHLMYRKKLYYIKSVKQEENTKTKDKRINLNIRKVYPKHCLYLDKKINYEDLRFNYADEVANAAEDLRFN